MRKDFWKSESGFTFMEILASVALLSIGLVALASMQVLSIRGNMGGEERSIAASLVASKIQEFSAMRYEMNSSSGIGYADPQLIAGALPAPLKLNRNGLTAEQMTVMYGADSAMDEDEFHYEMTWMITDIGDQAGPGSYKTITVSVTWFDRSTKGRNDVTNPIIVLTTVPLSPRFI